MKKLKIIETVPTGYPAKVSVESVVTTRYSLELSGADLKRQLAIPEDARVTISIPGGGDWSNSNLDLDDGHKIDIRWETTFTETDLQPV
jgi:hypothetical protein